MKGVQSMIWKITKPDIPYLALGARVLSAGGGGDPFTIQHLIQSIMSEKKEIPIVSHIHLQPDQFIVPVLTLGSSSICNEKMSTGDEGLHMLAYYEQISGRKADALLTKDIGGTNALIPFIIAAQLDLPVVDGDGMGRGFPLPHMTTFHLLGIKAAPMVLMNQTGESDVLIHEHTMELSSQARESIARLGGIVYAACYGMTGAQARTAMIPGTVSLIYELGKMLASKPDRVTCLQQLVKCLSNSVLGQPQLLIQGKVHAIKRWFVNGSVVGTFEVWGIDQWEGVVFEIPFANEYLAAKMGEKYVCLPPDFLLIIDDETLTPCLIEDIQEDLPVTVYGVPAPSILRSKQMLEWVGPQAFGLDHNFYPLEMLVNKEGVV